MFSASRLKFKKKRKINKRKNWSIWIYKKIEFYKINLELEIKCIFWIKINNAVDDRHVCVDKNTSNFLRWSNFRRSKFFFGSGRFNKQIPSHNVLFTFFFYVIDIYLNIKIFCFCCWIFRIREKEIMLGSYIVLFWSIFCLLPWGNKYPSVQIPSRCFFVVVVVNIIENLN